MAENNSKTKTSSKPLKAPKKIEADGDANLFNLDTRQVSSLGVKQIDGVVLEECQHELRYPHSIQTYKNMKKDSVVYAGTEFIENKIAAVPWSVHIPEGYEDELSDKAEKVKQIIGDMDSSFTKIIRQAATFNSYGFSCMEMVFRYRRKEFGSKYNDGYIGLKNLHFISQDTIPKWKFDKKNKKLLGVYQEPFDYSNYTSYGGNSGGDLIDNGLNFIPHRKLLHFVNNPDKESPEGYSPLKACWEAWKYKTAYQKVESQGVAKESHGLKTLYIPPQYLAEDASADNKKAFEYFKTLMLSIDNGSSSSSILPLLLDERGNKMFEMDVQNLTGSANYKIDEIIARYNNDILTALFASVITLGNSGGGGSHALSESKLSIVESMIVAKLEIIKSVLNDQLIKAIFERNGWDTTVMPFFNYGEVANVSMSEFAKSVQLIKAVGMLPVNRTNVNWVMDNIGSPYRVPEQTTDQELKDMLGEDTSRSGDGLSTPTGGLDGTAKTASAVDRGTLNKENN